LRDLPKEKIPREICGGGEPAIFLHSHVPMERCFDGTDQENSKTRGERGQIMKVQKNKKERMEERKRRDFFLWYVEVPILIMCSSLFGNALRLPPLCNPPSGEPTCMGTSPTKNNNSDRCMEQSHLSGFCFFSPVLVCNLKPF
jgi:hypothetical protein